MLWSLYIPLHEGGGVCAELSNCWKILTLFRCSLLVSFSWILSWNSRSPSPLLHHQYNVQFSSRMWDCTSGGVTTLSTARPTCGECSYLSGLLGYGHTASDVRATFAPPSEIHSSFCAVLSSRERGNQSEGRVGKRERCKQYEWEEEQWGNEGLRSEEGGEDLKGRRMEKTRLSEGGGKYVLRLSGIALNNTMVREDLTSNTLSN